jgi:hypothetical protein
MVPHIVEFVGGRLEGAVVSKSALAGETWDAPQAIVEFANDARQIAQLTESGPPPVQWRAICSSCWPARNVASNVAGLT